MTDERTDSYQELLDQHDYQLPKVGEIRKGIIVAINEQDVIVDLGLKRDGLVPPTDLSKLDPEERANLQVNDEIDVYVLNTSEPDALQVSINLARLNQDWIEAEKLMESGELYEGEVIGYNKGGAIIPFGRLRGFVPASHLKDLTPGMGDRKRQQRLAKLRGDTLPLKIIEVDRRRRRLVFSQREAQKEWEEIRKQELLENLEEGSVLTGRVSGLRDFGIFVDLGGADGLVHISELAWHRVDHPREVIHVGDEIEVYVLKLDRKDQRISLSRKRLLPNPWSTVEERYDIHQLVEGTITRIVDYGAFAEVEPGIEGLLHISQLSRSTVSNPSEVVNEGEVHLLRVVSIDPKRQRMGLSLRAVTANEQIEWMAQREIETPEQDEETTAVAETSEDETAVDTAAVAEAEAVVEELTNDTTPVSEEE
ncbi:MAG: S1 RNA-binding domain-containing protein [Anaerolineales bacterium]|nr:S1 RNA-binding domain-containing protein [Anaerolineales bacterium]